MRKILNKLLAILREYDNREEETPQEMWEESESPRSLIPKQNNKYLPTGGYIEPMGIMSEGLLVDAFMFKGKCIGTRETADIYVDMGLTISQRFPDKVAQKEGRYYPLRNGKLIDLSWGIGDFVYQKNYKPTWQDIGEDERKKEVVEEHFQSTFGELCKKTIEFPILPIHLQGKWKITQTFQAEEVAARW
jgi:hypothetical protein